ncbi:hypothetical protein Ddc_15618 [Ditylenchus destructor]|nr:hypothetical protein Ddc_15618 [Ditylenchus destructor]
MMKSNDSIECQSGAPSPDGKQVSLKGVPLGRKGLLCEEKSGEPDTLTKTDDKSTGGAVSQVRVSLKDGTLVRESGRFEMDVEMKDCPGGRECETKSVSQNMHIVLSKEQLADKKLRAILGKLTGSKKGKIGKSDKTYVPRIKLAWSQVVENANELIAQINCFHFDKDQSKSQEQHETEFNYLAIRNFRTNSSYYNHR